MYAYSPTGSPILGTSEICPCRAEIIEDSYERDAEGKLIFEYAGGTEMFYDGQRIDMLDGEELYLDMDGAEWKESELVFAAQPLPEAAAEAMKAAFVPAAPRQLPSLSDVLERAESFIAGFEGDETQEGIDALLADLRKARAGETEAKAPTLAIIIRGGALQAVIADDAPAATRALHGVVLIDFDTDGVGDDIIEVAQDFVGGMRAARVVDCSIERPEIDFAAVLREMDARNEGEADGQPSE